jgi:hypothetical protein
VGHDPHCAHDLGLARATTGISHGVPTVALTPPPDEQATAALRRRAELQGRSVQDVARQAIRDHIERNSKRELLGRVLDPELPRHAEALERLSR